MGRGAESADNVFKFGWRRYGAVLAQVRVLSGGPRTRVHSRRAAMVFRSNWPAAPCKLLGGRASLLGTPLRIDARAQGGACLRVWCRVRLAAGPEAFLPEECRYVFQDPSGPR